MRNIIISMLCCTIFCIMTSTMIFAQSQDEPFSIHFQTRTFTPQQQSSLELSAYCKTINQKHALLQFDHILSSIEKEQLAANGIYLLSYIPYYAWYAYLDNANIEAASGLRYLDRVTFTDKISPYIQERGIAERGLLADNKAGLTVVFFADVPIEQIESMLGKYGSGEMITSDTWEITINPDNIYDFANEDIVQWLEDLPPEKITHLNTLRDRIGANDVQAAPYNLHGNGYTVAMWDAGRAWGHTDYASRLTNGDIASNHYHATLVCGIIAGNGSRSDDCGSIEGYWRGIATEANVITYDWNNHTSEHSTAINNYHADISQHAWGYDNCQTGYCDGFGDYDSYSRIYDQIVRGSYGDLITVVASAGNEGQCSLCSGSLPHYPYGTVSGPMATSKNALSISATHANSDSWWVSSSRGPTDDGRIKPDICAPGCKTYDGITTTYTDNCYNSDYCGTSFSSPATSGSAILMYEAYNNINGEDPWPSTIRALFYHTAADLGYNGPDYAFGYGRINIKDAVDVILNDAGLSQKIVQDNISNGQTDTYLIEVAPGQSSLKVTLAWDDKEASSGSGIKLVNNLDLELVSPSMTTYYPFVLDPDNPSLAATTGVDNRNNMEQVEVSSPESGYWIARIIGATIPYGPQNYTLIGDFTTSNCIYTPGDINSIGGVTGGDVTYLVNYFRGLMVPPDSCWNDNTSRYFYVACDVNGDCAVSGSDVTYLVNYFRGLTQGLIYCPQLPPGGGSRINTEAMKNK